MKFLGGIVIAFIIFVVVSMIGSSGNLQYVKERSCEKWLAQGFQCVDYEGYEWGWGGWFGMPYGGAKVWHKLRKIPDNGITYSGYIQRWGDELQVYGPDAHDAIRGGIHASPSN